MDKIQNSEYKELFRNGIEMDDLDSIPNLLKDGLEIIYLCANGEVRSRAAADLTTEYSPHKSKFIHGGLEKISELPIVEQENLRDMLSNVPYLVTIIDEVDQRKYRDTLKLLESKRVLDDTTVITNDIFYWEQLVKRMVK